MTRAQTALLASLLLVGLGCGDDSGTPPGGDGSMTDGTSGGDADTGSDAPVGGPQGPGDLCATGAQPPNPGSCGVALTCCNFNGSTVCIAADECPGGNMWVQCQNATDCDGIGGRACCDVPSLMTFCTKPTTCDDYGGTIL